jgi:cytochrome c oxidase cbb3-type subunit 2/cytochrome c oxidase cbb3-type subunit I/II
MADLGRAVRTSYAVATVAGVAFFAVSVVLLGVWPGRVLDRQMREMAPGAPLALTPSEQRGRLIYGREGCAYCHTQQVRFLHADMLRFGAPTLAWETQVDYPHLWGTRRIGPDLSRQTAVHTEDWHYAHLFDPRALAPRSVMPAYQALFDGSPLRPRQEARDLVAYLDTLGRARELAAPEGEARARERCNCPDDEMAQMAFAAAAVNAHPARTQPSADGPALPPAAAGRRGQDLYADRCAGCHGPEGAGDGPAAQWLSPRPADLTAHRYTRARLSDALWHGVAGTAMQAFRDHGLDDLAALAATVDGLASAAAGAPSETLETEALGAEVYRAHCAQCHGAEGDGRGSAAAELRVAATSFKRQRATLAHALEAIRAGVEGTQMAPWGGRLSEAEQQAVARYVRTLFVPDAPGPGGR